MVKYTGRGLVVKRPGVLSKVQMLNLVLGVGVFSLLPIWGRPEKSLFRKSLVSVKFVSAILGPETAALILWTPGKMRSFCRKNLCP